MKQRVPGFFYFCLKIVKQANLFSTKTLKKVKIIFRPRSTMNLTSLIFCATDCSYVELILQFEIPGPVFTKHSQEHSLSFSPVFVNLNVTQLLYICSSLK